MINELMTLPVGKVESLPFEPPIYISEEDKNNVLKLWIDGPAWPWKQTVDECSDYCSIVKDIDDGNHCYICISFWANYGYFSICF